MQVPVHWYHLCICNGPGVAVKSPGTAMKSTVPSLMCVVDNDLKTAVDSSPRIGVSQALGPRLVTFNREMAPDT